MMCLATVVPGLDGASVRRWDGAPVRRCVGGAVGTLGPVETVRLTHRRTDAPAYRYRRTDSPGILAGFLVDSPRPMMMPYRCWAEVDLLALRQNLSWIRHRVGPAVQILTVVKADAYGHGLKQIAAQLMQSGTDLFGVANLAEARLVRNVGRGWPVLLLGAALPDEIEEVIRAEVMATISSLEEARLFSRAARRLRRPARLQLKVDTGMGRLGVAAPEAASLFARAARLPGIELCGVYTHFAAAEDDASFTRRQQKIFEKVRHDIGDVGKAVKYWHASNSAALLTEPECVYNTVRPGLLVYGILPPGRRESSSGAQKTFIPALSWQARVAFVKTIAAGTSLGYGRRFKARRAMKIATVTAGYGDGYPRAGSNRAQVLIGGKRCRVLGSVTMDQLMADVSHLPAVQAGDAVTFVGHQGKDQITASDLAEWCQTVPWEILTNISYRVPRIYRGSAAA